jgi:hypothetical protein
VRLAELRLMRARRLDCFLESEDAGGGGQGEDG